MKKLVLLSSLLVLTAQAQATSIIMEGDFVKTAVSDNGTLGYGSTTSPGIIHDATGTGTFGVDDYLTPGSPWEGFSVRTGETGLKTNNNTSPTFGGITGSISDISGASPYDQAVNFTGAYGDFFSISTDTFFNDGDERISMTTTITALKDLTAVSFARFLDPDPDVKTYGSYDTVNGRGASGLAAEDWVHAEGTRTGLTIGLYTESDIEHNTAVTSAWSDDPSVILGGQMDGDGDYAIGLAFLLGDMFKGDSMTFTYHYVMGDSLDTVDIPDTAVPVPAAAYLFAPALLGLMGLRRKAKQA